MLSNPPPRRARRPPWRWYAARTFLHLAPPWRGRDRLSGLIAGDLSTAPPGTSWGTFGPGIRYSVDFSQDSSLRALFFLPAVPPALVPILEATLREGGCFYDVGANIGVYALWAATLVGPAGQVHAFEPVPETNALLRRMVSENQATNLTVVDAAAGDREGSVELVTLAGASGLSSAVRDFGGRGQATIDAPMISLDSYARRHRPPDLVKIDVEGFERSVLLGMRDILADVRPLVVFEADAGHLGAAGTSVSELADLVGGAGYGIWNLTRSGVRRMTGQTSSGNVLAAHEGTHGAVLTALAKTRFPSNQSL